MRIGTNHGSLSDRILNRYGDTPLGMVESALEFARIARNLDYHDFVFSMKASNPKVMIAAYRLLVARLNELNAEEAAKGRGGSPEPPGRLGSIATTWNYPLHLGVTEAGEGEDARIKSAIGIGSLLADGIGDTIRVSLTEDSPHEIPVAKALIENIRNTSNAEHRASNVELSFDPFSYQRRATEKIERDGVKLGGDELIRVVVRQANFDKIAHKIDRMGDYKPEIVYEDANIIAIDPRDDETIAKLNAQQSAQFVTVTDEIDLPVIAAFRLLAAKLQPRHPILLKDVFRHSERSRGIPSDNLTGNQRGPSTPLRSAQDDSSDFLQTLLTASTNIGSLLCDGIGDAVLVQGEEAPGQALRLSYNILQAAGSRIFKTDYVACPSCGRTLFNLQTTTAKSSHLASERRKDRHHGMHCERARRNGRCGFRLCRRRARQSESLCRQDRSEIQHSRSRSSRSTERSHSRAREMDRTRTADSRARARFIAQRRLSTQKRSAKSFDHVLSHFRASKPVNLDFRARVA